MSKIKKRIEELEIEVKKHQVKLTQFQQSTQEIQVTIISKSGALLELRKLEESKE